MRNFYIDCEITDELATTVQKFVDECNADPDNGEAVIITINSGGGSVSAGMAIHDALATLTAPTTARIVGLCASAATYGALACDRVEMARNAHFLVHPVTGGLYGTIDELEKDLDYMAELEGRMMALYAAKTGLDLAAVKEIVAKGEYLDAQTALNFGFVDFVDGLIKEAPAQEEQEQEDEAPAQEQEAPAQDDEQEQEQEQGGIVNRILTLAGVKKRGHIIHRPAELEADYQAEISNLKESIAAKDMELENMARTLEAKAADFEAYKAAQLAELESMQNSVKESLAALDNRVKVEVHNHLAALGYSPDDMPAPVEPQNTAPATLSDGEKFLKELGLR